MPNSSGGRSIVRSPRPWAISIVSARTVWPSLTRSRKTGSIAARQDRHADRLAAVVHRLVGAEQVIPGERAAGQ